MTYREFATRLKDFGVAEYRGRGKGGERFLVRETVPGSGKGPSHTIGYHGDGKDVARGTQRACLRRLGIPPHDFYQQ
ncbi:MAG: hypothetical protein ACRERD_14395 [Candidatus Binatia bacterium]